MIAHIQHSGGIIQAVIELGFDQVKYFEGSIGGTATGFSISPPARRLILNNRSTTGNVYLRVDGEDAEVGASFTPGDNIKIGPGCSFTMDFDSLSSVSLIADAPSVDVEGILGFKGTVSC